MTDLTHLSISAALDKLNRREISAVELTQDYLERIEQLEPQIHAYITRTAERALGDAKAADEARANGDERPLLGIPLAIKDVI
ncbi:hypothetical protein B7486_77455, partial [cyanobacterium TDX16]